MGVQLATNVWNKSHALLVVNGLVKYGFLSFLLLLRVVQPEAHLVCCFRSFVDLIICIASI